MMAAVSVSPVWVQDAMSPTAITTVPLASAAVWNVQVALVVENAPSVALAYH